MIPTINKRVISPSEIHAAGFICSRQLNAACCLICKLEITPYSHNGNLFDLHAKQSPNCIIVRLIQSTNINSKYPSDSLSDDNSISSENPRKQQNLERSTLNEVNVLKDARRKTFSNWPHSESFRSQMIEAGFFSCYQTDRVICIYCKLIFEQWNETTDDPCEIHQLLSPDCIFVKSKFDSNSSKCKNIKSTLPTHIDYVDPQKRTDSFVNWSMKKFPSIDELVHAGFFYDGSKIKCFYCNGSFNFWQINYHPIAEHVRWFPYCNYARQLCGEELYHSIEKSTQTIPQNIEIAQLEDDYQRLTTNIDNELLKDIASRLDLPLSRLMLQETGFERRIIELCWKYQLQLNNDDFNNQTDLYIACYIIHQVELSNAQKHNTIIPCKILKEIYENKQISLNNQYRSSIRSNVVPYRSYNDICTTFEKDFQRYKTHREKSAVHFVENKSISIEREKSFVEPSEIDLIKGGWILSNENNCAICPHCFMIHTNWKSNVNPLLIHKYLSPLCLFVLSKSPLILNSIPIKKMEEQFTNEDIKKVAQHPYDGLVESKYQLIFSVHERIKTFNKFPGGFPNDGNNLAISGFYYDPIYKRIKCFYCQINFPVYNYNSKLKKDLNKLHSMSMCPYYKQMNDNDKKSPKQNSSKCACCKINDKQLFVLPCRHYCLCQSCGQIKHLCPICKGNVATYVIVYSS